MSMSIAASAAQLAGSAAAGFVVKETVKAAYGVISSPHNPSQLLDKSGQEGKHTHFDPIACVMGLGAAGAIGEPCKMTRRIGWLEPVKTIFGVLSSITPTFMQKFAEGSERRLRGDSREDLYYYKRALPYVARLYPISQDDKAITNLWQYVKKGITNVAASYKLDVDDKEILSLFKELTADVDAILKIDQPQEQDGGSEEAEEKKDDGLSNSAVEILKKTVEKLTERVHTEGNAEDGKIVRILEKVLQDRKVPDSISPVSERIKKIWTRTHIEHTVENIDRIASAQQAGNETNKTASLVYLQQVLDEQSGKYNEAMRDEISKMKWSL